MTTWVLIIFVGVGSFGDGEANALTSVHGFATQAQCAAAGAAVREAFGSGSKRVVTVCAEQGAK